MVHGRSSEQAGQKAAVGLIVVAGRFAVVEGMVWRGLWEQMTIIHHRCFVFIVKHLAIRILRYPVYTTVYQGYFYQDKEYTHDISGRRRGIDRLPIPPSAIPSTVHLVLASCNMETAGAWPENLVPPLGRVDEGRDVRYLDMGKANGMMFFQCKDLELLTGVNQAERTNC